VSCLSLEHKGSGQDLIAGPLAPKTGPLTSKKNKITVTLSFKSFIRDARDVNKNREFPLALTVLTQNYGFTN